ncbi:UDP-galactopyranose mutase [Extibacter sp. GGCC_0201]|uniref:UDP-galactopyranose mutase n=1 Tax=Extibacter sp. GGCC_0201 TaxID=2731209 RepID=UPI001AA176FB|nr:UDP-galactopyranose mutase [Extibacter sp. GGCC_0201]MBO1720430.1 UDP-galactopyranose mutase [Extibacter sp. GGCC_0201]
MFDYLIVGSGLFGSIFASEARKKGYSCLVVEKRSHVGGNIYTKEVEGIQVHEYGAHIFHTSNKEVWEYIRQFAEFNRYTNSPIAYYKGEIYNMPFNMNTFNKMWGVVTPEQARKKIAEQIEKYGVAEPKNLEEQAINLVGKDIYEKLVKGYTEKQWGRRATELPPEIIRRLPVRMTYDNNYFNDCYQGIPIGGYTQIIEKMLDGIEVRLDTDYLEEKEELDSICGKIIYTGPIDAYYNYKYGELEYRSVRFETEVLDEENHQGNAVVNYTEYEVPYTRIIEHKHFEFGTQPKTVVSKEYSAPWKRGDEPYYPVNNERNNQLYEKYASEAAREEKVTFGGRLGKYKYYDMHHIVAEALACARENL